MSHTPILDGIIDAMTVAVEFEKPLSMPAWFRDPEKAAKAEDIHTCGTAACVIGYAVLHRPLRELVGLTAEIGKSEDDWRDGEAENVALAWTKELQGLGFSLDASREIRSSLIAGYPMSREWSAKEVKLPKALRRSTHLQSEATTAKDALEYATALRTWILENAA